MVIQNQIDHIGEEKITSLLKANGYHSVFHNPSSIYLEADGSMRRMVLLVKSSSSNEQIQITTDEVEEIKTYAEIANREPWIACVNIVNGQTNISWFNLSHKI